MTDTAANVILVICCVVAVLITAVRLPGTWMIVLAALLYGWWDGWTEFGGKTIMLLAGIALFGELIEFLCSAITTRRAGGSRRAAWSGLLGGIIGMFALSFLVPMPVIGTMVGALAGCFLGAMIGELTVKDHIGQGARVGFFSAIGFALGMLTKIAIAVAMSGVLLFAVFDTEK